MKNPTVLRSYDTPAGHRALDCFLGVKDASVGFEVDTNRASATGIFAASSKDRGGDILEIAGIDLAGHRGNPIVMFLHGFDYRDPDGQKPIGVTEDPANGNYGVKLYPEKGIAVATTWFTQKTLLASQIAALVMEKTIRAQSIGYRELKVERLFEGERFVGNHLLEVEMVETSWVPIPMQAEAIRSALSRDWAGKSLSPAIKWALQPYAAAAPTWSPGVTLTKRKKAMHRKDSVDDNALARAQKDDEESDGDEDTTASLEKHGSKCCRKAYKKLRQAHKACKDAAAGLDDDSDTADVINDAGDAVDASANAIRLHHSKKYKDEDPIEDEDSDAEGGDVQADAKDDDALDDAQKAEFFELRRLMAHLDHHERLAAQR